MGGLGDISFDFSQTVGMEGRTSCFSPSIPTGQYDVKRGSDASREIPASFQRGSGPLQRDPRLEYTRDTDKEYGSIIVPTRILST